VTDTVRRFVLTDAPTQTVQLSAFSFPVSVAYQGGLLCLFVVTDPADPVESWSVLVVKTDGGVAEDASFVGSALAPDGQFRHVFAQPPADAGNADAGDGEVPDLSGTNGDVGDSGQA